MQKELFFLMKAALIKGSKGMLNFLGSLGNSLEYVTTMRCLSCVESEEI